MKRVVFAFTCIAALSGCSLNSYMLKTSEGISIDIIKTEMWLEAFSIKYRITNNYSYDVWLCFETDYDGYYDDITIKEDTLFIKLKHFEIPDEISSNRPLISGYFRLASGASYEGEYGVFLPVIEESPITPEEECFSTTCELNHLVFELGYFEEDLSGKTSESIKEYMDLETPDDLETINDLVWLINSWEGMKREKTIKVDMAGLKIPCCIPGESPLFVLKEKPSDIVKVEIENVEVSQENFNFDYKITNIFSQDIWICDDTLMDWDVRVGTKIENDILLISLRFPDLPDRPIFYEVGLWAKYIRLPVGKTHRGKVLLNLPIENRPILDPELIEIRSSKPKTINKIRDVVFEVGFFVEDLSKSISGWNYSEICKSKNVACIPIDGAILSKELKLQTNITGLKVPCYENAKN